MSERREDPVPARDDGLLAELGSALGHHRPPAGLAGRAEELFALRELDTALARLLDADRAEPAGLRGGPGGAALEFALADGTPVLTLDPDGDRLAGRVLTGGVERVSLERPGAATVTVAVDNLGGFSLSPSGAGPARLRLSRAGASVAVTDWFTL